MPDLETVVHHQRAEEGEIRTLIVNKGEIDLTPPGLTLAVEQFFGSNRR